MTLRADSYSTTSEVKAYTRHLLDGQTAFNSTTRPRATELEKFIDRASGVLNAALANVGLTIPISNTTAKLSCDDWVTAQSVKYVELTQRGVGWTEQDGSRINVFASLHKKALEFARENALGFKRLGAAVSHKASEGLKFTGEDATEERPDLDDTGLRQPIFRRGLFEDSSVSLVDVSNEEDDD